MQDVAPEAAAVHRRMPICKHYWWRIEDPPEQNDFWMRGSTLAVPEGADPWLLVSGVSCGSLAGGEHAELWAWNGSEPRLVGQLGCLDF